jgi:5'-3' exoribonuclease 1
MGIHYFFKWFKSRFLKNMKNMPRGVTFADLDISVDNLMIDMNGVFHNSAQKIYEYGNFKPPQRLLSRRPKKKYNNYKKQERTFKDVCESVENLFNIVGPTKRLILCVDGVAPLAKQHQQRGRRYRSSMDISEDSPFDTASITPGTKFMDYLSKYIDWFIRKKMSEDKNWQGIEVIFSNEKVAQEGEQKLLNYIRFYGDKNESYCINGMDADLIMLALGSHVPKFHIIREDLYDRGNEFFAIDIGETRKDLVKILKWEGCGGVFSEEFSINDFIFLCFIAGNDFLPHVPSLEIIENGIDVIVDVYKNVCSEYGHITKNVEGNLVFNKKSLAVFLGTIGQYEKGLFDEKLSKKKSFFPDLLLEKHVKIIEGKYDLDIESYRAEYNSVNFPDNKSMKEICHSYLEGMQWVLSYYTKAVPSWKWYFPYHYSPFAYDLAKHIETFEVPYYGRTVSSTPFKQLLSVLPPNSARLIPSPLCNFLLNRSSPLKKYCPDDVKIDLSGKKREWEGVVLLPMIDQDVIEKIYFDNICDVDQRELKRNKGGRSFVYFYSHNMSYSFQSYYGDIPECKVRLRIIEL